MKIRLGFETNCSSASYIVSKDLNGSVFKIADDMIQHMIDDERDVKGGMEYKKNLEKLEPVCDPNTPVKFDTCGYHTLIAKNKDGDYLIATCNNYNFVECLSGIIDSGGDEDSIGVRDKLLGKIFVDLKDLREWEYTSRWHE